MEPLRLLQSPAEGDSHVTDVLLPQGLIVAALEELGLEVWEPICQWCGTTRWTSWRRAPPRHIPRRAGRPPTLASSPSDVAGVGRHLLRRGQRRPIPDEGVMVELGSHMAIRVALGKYPTFLFRDDFRRVVESEQYPLNLMLGYVRSPACRSAAGRTTTTRP